MRWRIRVGLFSLLLLLGVMMFGKTYVDAQILCYITSTNVNPGQGASVPAGQPVEFNIALTGSCPAPGIYTLRADIINPGTSAVISTNRIQLVANGQFSTVLSESAVAPMTIGPWSLQVSVYILANGAVVGPSSQQSFGLNIVPYTPTSTTSTMVTTQSTIEVTGPTTTSSFKSSTTNETSLVQITSIMTTTESTGDNTLLFARLAALTIVVALFLIAITIRRRHERAKKEHTRVY